MNEIFIRRSIREFVEKPVEKDKIEMLLWLEHLEFNLLDLPKPDKVIFLYLPFEVGKKLRECRSEVLDGAEKDENHLKNAEETYLLMSERYKFDDDLCDLCDELPWIKKITSKLKKMASERKGRLSGFMLQSAVDKNLQIIIEKLQNEIDRTKTQKD